MSKKTVVLLIAYLAILCFVGFGCITCTDASGNTTKQLDPNSLLLKGAEAVAEGVSIVAPLFGGIGVFIGGVASGILGAWRTVKPKLLIARTTSKQYLATATATVTAIETFKKLSPEAWDKLKGVIEDQLVKAGADKEIIERVINTIRAAVQASSSESSSSQA